MQSGVAAGTPASVRGKQACGDEAAVMGAFHLLVSEASRAWKE
jgi:hypothetical protein